MTIRNAEASPIRYARIAGIGLLLMAVFAMFANFFVFESLVIPGDAVTTANNIVANEMLFRGGIIGFIAVLVLDVLVAWALYGLFLPVHKMLALLGAWLRLIYTAIFAVALNNILNVLLLLNGAEYLTEFETGQLQAQIMLSLNAFNFGWLNGFVFFGLHLLVIGYLILKSGCVPRIIGIVLIIAAFAYVLDSIAHFLLPNYSDYEAVFVLIVAVPGALGEISLALWLLIKGVKVRQT
ncbi:DUF4386 domain-containing protein [Paenibacillus tarimensis]